MARRVARCRQQGDTAVAKHVKVALKQTHLPILLERRTLVWGKSPVDFRLLDQQHRGWNLVNVADMVAMGVRDRNEGDVCGLDGDLRELSGERLRTGRVSD